VEEDTPASYAGVSTSLSSIENYQGPHVSILIFLFQPMSVV